MCCVCHKSDTGVVGRVGGKAPAAALEQGGGLPRAIRALPPELRADLLGAQRQGGGGGVKAEWDTRGKEAA